jgi:hypothetical protein
MTLEEAAEILAKGCCGVSVYGERPIEPWHVKALAQEWLKLTEGDRWRTPLRRSLWDRLFRRGTKIDVSPNGTTSISRRDAIELAKRHSLSAEARHDK